jgi:ABC-2 type transport system permease protein
MPASAPASVFGKIWILTLRELRSWARSPFFSLSFLVGPFIWVFVFGNAFNSAFFSSGGGASTLEGAPNYFSFLATGMLVVMPMTFSGRTGTSIFADRAKGYLDRLLVSPTSRETIVHAKVFGSMILGMLQAAVLLLVAVPFGLHIPSFSPLSIAILVVSVLLLSYGFSTVYLIISMRIRRWATQQFAVTLLSTPIMFISNTFYPSSKIPQWIGGLAGLNPISYAVNITRGLFFGGEAAVNSTLLFNVGVLVLFAGACSIALFVTSRKWL